MSCNGVCHRYRASNTSGTSRYVAGHKRCNLCDIYIKWDGLFCPCCNVKLRATSHYAKYKKKFVEVKRI